VLGTYNANAQGLSYIVSSPGSKPTAVSFSQTCSMCCLNSYILVPLIQASRRHEVYTTVSILVLFVVFIAQTIVGVQARTVHMGPKTGNACQIPQVHSRR